MKDVVAAKQYNLLNTTIRDSQYQWRADKSKLSRYISRISILSLCMSWKRVLSVYLLIVLTIF